MAGVKQSSDSALQTGYVDLGGMNRPTGSAWFDCCQGPDYRKRSPDVEEPTIAHVESVRDRKNAKSGP